MFCRSLTPPGPRALGAPPILAIAILMTLNPNLHAENPPDAQPWREPADRCAAWQRTMAFANTHVPNMAVMTYQNSGMANAEQWLLAKISPVVHGPEGPVAAGAAEDCLTLDLPGGLSSTFTLGGRAWRAALHPVLTPRISEHWDGAAVYRIRATDPSPSGPALELHVGGGRPMFMHFNPVPLMVDDETALTEASWTALDDSTARMTSSRMPITAVLRAPGGRVRIEADGHRAVFELAATGGDLVLGYATTPERASRLATVTDPENAVRDVQDHYRELLDGCRIETPDARLNEAFRTAAIVNEYCWFEPFGWIEGIHHWVTLWHQQHIGAACWMGQTERARQCLLETAARQFDDGAMPHLQPTGARRRDWGGCDQFYSWQAEQYWRLTGDEATLRELLEPLRRSLDFVVRNNDPDGDGLLAWGLQIGNQEDFISTPHNGTTPSVEGWRMMRLLADLERALGDRATAAALRERAEGVRRALQRELWLRELGRAAFYRDPADVVRPDGMYHSLAYPVQFGLLDPFESYTCTRHLLDRLTGPNGETYCSNAFPDHLRETWPTWGMQAGAAQQPWAAWAYAAAGRRNAAVRPLQAVAAWVTNDYLRGAWPEVALEPRHGYFSPPAALYIQAMIEAVFGLRPDVPERVLNLRPCMPDDWTRARLKLPGYLAEYAAEPGRRTMRVVTPQPWGRAVRWPLPPARVTGVTVNGAPVDFRVVPAVGGVELRFDASPARETMLVVEFAPAALEIDAPGSSAEGETLTVRVDGALIAGVIDPAGVARAWRLEGTDAVAIDLARGRPAPWLEYGRLGRLNFSRQTVFVDCVGEGFRTWLPLDFTVVPRVEAALLEPIDADAQRKPAMLRLRNNLPHDLDGPGAAWLRGHRVAFTVALPARGELVIALQLTEAMRAALTPGENTLRLELPAGEGLELIALARKATPAERFAALELPEAGLIDSAQWHTLREFHNHDSSLWKPAEPPLAALAAMEWIEVPDLPGVPFRGNGGRMLTAGNGRVVRVALEGERAIRKVYLLTIAFVNYHDMYVPVARIELTAARGAHSALVGRARHVRTLHFPGDLDWFHAVGTVMKLSTWHAPRGDRHGLLPPLGRTDADWPAEIARPPAFPQPELWCDSATLATPHAVLNVIEVPVEPAMPLAELSVSGVATDPVLGICAVTVEYDR